MKQLDFLKWIPMWMVAMGLCMAFFLLSFFSTQGWGDGERISKGHSLTVDELSHLPAGYYYLQTGRYLVNPEHPPLVKDIAALPLLFLHPNFQISPEFEYANDQWNFGRQFLYYSNNDPDQLMFWARTTVLLVNTLLLFWAWTVVARVWTTRAATIILFLVASSPLVISHAALITMDVMTSLFQVIAIASAVWYVVQFKHNQSVRLAGLSLIIATTGALLSKFSALLVLPGILVGAVLFISQHVHSTKRFKTFSVHCLLIGACIVGLLTAYYSAHILNLSADDVIQQIDKDYAADQPQWGKSVLHWAAQTSLPTRALAEYAVGTMLVSNRLQGAYQVTYFLGHVYENVTAGWRYFPVLFITKLSLPVLMLMCATLLWALRRGFKAEWRPMQLLVRWANEPFTVMLWWYIVTYSIMTFGSTIQIGVRHIMPVIIMSIVLLGRGIDRWWGMHKRISTAFWVASVSIVVTLVITFPYYLSYYHTLAGGVEHGYEIATDSNYDWGQDLKRLGNWVRENNVQTLYIDLFTSTDVSHYIGNIGQGYSIGNGNIPPPGSYIAVSIFQYQNNRYADIPLEHKYTQLDAYQVARIGTSIIVYQVPESVRSE